MPASVNTGQQIASIARACLAVVGEVSLRSATGRTRCTTGVLLGSILCALQPPGLSAAVQVEQWDTHEIVFTGPSNVENPFVDVSMSCTFRHADRTAITVNGFHDGDGRNAQDGNVWKVRFMPTKTGSWTWKTTSIKSELNSKQSDPATRIECVTARKPYLHGPLMTDGLHFKHADGTRRFLISTRLSCHFDDPKNWEPLVAFLKENRINRVFFMMVGNVSQLRLQWADPTAALLGRVLYGRDFEDQDASRFHLDAWRRIDRFIERLRVADILAGPYFYYFNDGFQKTLTSEQDDLFLKYGMARFGSFCNVMPVLGNQIEHKTQKRIHETYAVDYVWQNEKGGLLKKLSVYGQPVTVHNPAEGRTVKPSFWTPLFANPFASFAGYLLKQAQIGPMGDVKRMDDATPEWDDDDGNGAPECSSLKDLNERAFARHNAFCIELRNRYKIPIINEEPGYDFWEPGFNYAGMSWYHHSHDSMRATFWTAALGGGYAAWGSKATYATGENRAYPQMHGNMERHAWAKHWSADAVTAMKLTPTAAQLKIHHDFMVRLPYWEMVPDNAIVSGPTRNIEGEEFRTTFCLTKENAQYVVYALVGGRITVNLPQGSWQTRQLNPRDGRITDFGTKAGGQVTIELPESKPVNFLEHAGDWVLSFERPAVGGR